MYVLFLKKKKKENLDDCCDIWVLLHLLSYQQIDFIILTRKLKLH